MSTAAKPAPGFEGLYLEIARLPRIDVVTHNVSFDDGLKLPGCYRVKAVVRMEATR